MDGYIMTLPPKQISVFYVFLASPGDMTREREHVRRFFERYNRHTAHLWGARFEVVDWENYASVGVGRPQELITKQTLERFRDSLALVVGIMAQRFRSPTGLAESGTEEEFNWALESYRKTGYPEIKWFFRRIDSFIAPPNPDEIGKALEQWRKVCVFRKQIQEASPPMFAAEYAGAENFRDVFDNDLSRWLADPKRPWVIPIQKTALVASPISPPTIYHERIVADFRRLDIAGIDNDRTFEIPLSEIYVRLRVMLDMDSEDKDAELRNADPIDIQTALLRYHKLVIVGDPGSGKSTFLKYIALMLARSVVEGDPAVAREKLCLFEPLPIPVFLSCWDLADFLKQYETARLDALIDFVAARLAVYGFAIGREVTENLLNSGCCCLLFDGLDEVPTNQGRIAVSRLLEDCVDRFGGNRYLVTSRIRAYTGGTILKGNFIRCDIQPFDAHDRAEFIRNWVALLFRVLPEEVSEEETDAKREFDSLTRGIERNDRIRLLAVNPLLLTVMAIVHWNRKRFPEQRVDLYDECVDVLLGQRKEAEHTQISRKTDSLDEQREQRRHEELSWIRKRFAEIALHIQCLEGDHEEATKDDVVRLLIPRFIDKGAADEEQAKSRASFFLERQELQSGMLVSRHAQSYRFVHLTFQEYLSAWHLSNQEFDAVSTIIQTRLRNPKWFETLQLLGGEWANKSDEKLDSYISWLLTQQGTAIADKAPVVALCANIVADSSGVAELTLETRNAFQRAVKATLDAFKAGSGIPEMTQVEILDALGTLGASAKNHLIAATRSTLLSVRSRALAMLIPYLPDDDLFTMGHVFGDRSRAPVRVYLDALLERDVTRTIDLLKHIANHTGRAVEAIMERHETFVQHIGGGAANDLLTSIFEQSDGSQYTEHGAQLLGQQFITVPGAKELLGRIFLNVQHYEVKSAVRKFTECDVDDQCLLSPDFRVIGVVNSPPFLPKGSFITYKRTQEAAKSLKIPGDEVRRRYEKLNQIIPGYFILEWKIKDKNSAPR